jgi:hypothetical protein
MTIHLRLTRPLARPVPHGVRPPRRPLAALAAWLLEEPPGPLTAGARARVTEAVRFAPPH